MSEGRINPVDVNLWGGAYDAFLFDMDGVLTDTASVHSIAWKKSFDEFLLKWSQEHGTEFVPFDLPVDYPKYVDGKRREDGVRSFLESRGITLPEGTPDDAPTAETVRGVGNSKNVLLLKVLAEDGVEIFEDSITLLKEMKKRGYKTGVVSSSANTQAVLAAVGITDLFDVRIDGVIAAELKLPGKPAPDTFVEAATRLGAEVSRTVVLEDAESGVAAGRSGKFGLTIGVDRIEHAEELYENGADVVFSNLSDLLPAN